VLLRRSVQANIEYALAVAGVQRAERAARAQAALARARLAHLAGSPARVLSGGEQQLLSIARALATAPEILVLDEPTSNLDAAATKAIEALLGVVRSEGTRIVLITHDLGQARRLADEVAFLHRGRVVERTDRDDFFAQPKSEVAQAFLRGDIVL
jgi:tungstate transport system ATP-binding protein